MNSERLARWFGAGVLAMLLAGCAGKVTEPEPERKAVRLPIQVNAERPVTPRPLKVAPLAGYGPEQQLALALISHYLGAPLYRMSNPLPMSRDYQITEVQRSPNGQQVMVVMRHRDQAHWAMLTLTAAPGAVMNAFDVVRNSQPGYALVLKNMKICLVEGADKPPAWGSNGWRFSQTGPGRFECSGQTKGSLYQPYSGMPGLMGVYAEDGDAVLYGERWPELRDIASGLVTVFPNLQVPRIR